MLSFAFWSEVFEAGWGPLPAEEPLAAMADFKVGTLISDCWGISPSWGGPSDIADGLLSECSKYDKSVCNFNCWRRWRIMRRSGVNCWMKRILCRDKGIYCPIVICNSHQVAGWYGQISCYDVCSRTGFSSPFPLVALWPKNGEQWRLSFLHKNTHQFTKDRVKRQIIAKGGSTMIPSVASYRIITIPTEQSIRPYKIYWHFHFHMYSKVHSLSLSTPPPIIRLTKLNQIRPVGTRHFTVERSLVPSTPSYSVQFNNKEHKTNLACESRCICMYICTSVCTSTDTVYILGTREQRYINGESCKPASLYRLIGWNLQREEKIIIKSHTYFR